MDKKFFLLFLLIVFIDLFSISSSLQLHHEEPRRAIIAQEMIITNDYIVPRVYGEIYNKKPPLQNWFISLFAYKDKFVEDIDARLPSILSAFLLTFSVFLFFRKIDGYDEIYMSLMTLTSFTVFFTYSWKSEPDMLLALFVFLSYVFFIIDPTKFRNIFISSIFMGLGVLSKGVSFIYFYPGMLLYGFFYSDSKLKYYSRLLLHFLLSFLLPLLWLYMVINKVGIDPFINGYKSEIVQRVNGGSNVLDYLKHIFTFPVRGLLAFMPWSLFIFYLIKDFRRIKEFDSLRSSSVLILISTFLIFTFSIGGDGRYLLPATPFLIIAIYPYIVNKDLSDRLLIFVKYFVYFILSVIVLSIFIFKIYFIIAAVLVFLFIMKFYHNKKLINNIFISLLVIHIVYGSIYVYFRQKNSYNYEDKAISILKETGKDKDFFLEKGINPIQLIFYLEKNLGKVVYSDINKITGSYIFISPRESVEGCRMLFYIKYSKVSIPFIYIHDCVKN